MQVWDLTLRLGGQLRVVETTIIGFDMTAAFALAGALGVCPIAVAELLPDIEAAAVAARNQRMKEGSNG